MHRTTVHIAVTCLKRAQRSPTLTRCRSFSCSERLQFALNPMGQVVTPSHETNVSSYSYEFQSPPPKFQLRRHAPVSVCVCVCVCVRRRHTHNTTHTHTKVERDCLSICLSVCPSVCLSVSEICGCLLPTKSVITEQRTRSLLSQKEVHTKRKQKGGAQTLLFLTKHNKGHVFHVCRVFNDPGFEKQPLVALSRKQQGRQDVHEQLQRPKRRRVSDALMALTAGNPRVPGACECVRASWRQMRGSCVSTDRCVCVCVWCVCLGQVSGLHGSGRAGVCVCVCACVCEGCLSVDLDSDCSCDQKNQRSWVVTC